MVVTDAKIDWFRVIVDLERSGLSQREISVKADIGLGSIYGLKVQGAQPIFGRGVRILMLWMERTGRTTEQLPRLN